ncbi:MAG TPA: hypothetical protein VF522_22625 [Ramlibacter sp.]|uniref:hypothetical protein n=1 Tax=Ramlibacter sp. TaxID=1917967 RepID=UPI002ED4716D
MRRILCCATLVALGSTHAAAQVPAVGTEQRGGTYIEPPAQVDPVYTSAGPVAADEPARQPHLTLQLAADFPLRGGGTNAPGRGTQGSTAASPTLQASLRWVPRHDAFWFGQLTLLRYLHRDRQQPWHPDFTYSFGYEDFRPGTWSLVYANYTGTRLSPDRAAGERRLNFAQGQWTLSRRFALPETLQPVFLVGDGDQALCTAGLHVMPRYVEFDGGGQRSGKTSASLGCRYTRPEGWFAHLALQAWRRSQQQPWDPDFTYGFGYEHPGPGRFTVRYNNYSGNRFPGRGRGTGEGSFRSGSITISWTGEW